MKGVAVEDVLRAAVRKSCSRAITMSRRLCIFYPGGGGDGRNREGRGEKRPEDADVHVYC